MEKQIVKQWDANKDKLAEYFRNTPQREYCGSYLEILKKVFELVLIDKEYMLDKITVVDDGDYQGTQIFLIPENTYQPSESEYYITSVSYGSCSGCDTLQAINGYSDDEKPDENKVQEYMTLSLHLIQRMKTLSQLSEFAHHED